MLDQAVRREGVVSDFVWLVADARASKRFREDRPKVSDLAAFRPLGVAARCVRQLRVWPAFLGEQSWADPIFVPVGRHLVPVDHLRAVGRCLFHCYFQLFVLVCHLLDHLMWVVQVPVLVLD